MTHGINIVALNKTNKSKIMNALMKISVIICLLISQTSVYAQEGHIPDGTSSSIFQRTVKNTLSSEMDMKIRNIEENKIYSVDYLLYKNMTPGSIEFSDGNLISLNRVNFNVIRDQFFFQDLGNKYYLLDPQDGIKKVIMGNDIFEYFLVGDTYKPLKILFQNENIAFLKGYYVEVSSTNAPRTVFNATDGQKAKTATLYYIQQNGLIKEIELNKRSIYDLFMSQSSKNELKKFVKANRLSYKNEDDVKKILAEFF